jgi:spore germination cell wall hydrolase CwlJ-like protein
MIDPTIVVLASLLRTTDITPVDLTEVECIAHVVYHEARSEPLDAQIAVASAVVNRGRPCVVVNQPRQFATGGGKRRDGKGWTQASEVALLVATGVVHRYSATHFHDTSVKPYWTRNMEFVGQAGKMKFWRDRK